MKTDTTEVIIKGIAAVGGAVCIQAVSNLSQWSNGGSWPDRINWVVIILAACGSGFNALWSFMSGSYSSWKNGKNGNGGSAPPKPTT